MLRRLSSLTFAIAAAVSFVAIAQEPPKTADATKDAANEAPK
jgi:hypothetical protein